MSAVDSGTPENPPKAVTFDCWQTLIYEARWEIAHGLRVAALEQAARTAGLDLAPDEARLAFDAAWGRHMDLWSRQVATGAREVAHWALEEVGLDPHGAAFDPLLQAFEEASHSGEVCMIEGARETLTQLEAAGVGCALICDTGLTPGRVVRQLLDRHGLLAPLRETIFSDEWSLPKPHPRVFEAALAALGVSASEAFHVGDLRRTDVAGARAVGMGTIRLTAANDDSTPLADADHVARSHAEVRRILGVSSSSDILPQQSWGHPGDPLKAGLTGRLSPPLGPPYRRRAVSRTSTDPACGHRSPGAGCSFGSRPRLDLRSRQSNRAPRTSAR